jgi:hypothetical protein
MEHELNFSMPTCFILTTAILYVHRLNYGVISLLPKVISPGKIRQSTCMPLEVLIKFTKTLSPNGLNLLVLNEMPL